MLLDDYAREIEKGLGVTPTQAQAHRVRDIIRRSWREDRRIQRGLTKTRLDQKPRTNHGGVDMITLEDAHQALARLALALELLSRAKLSEGTKRRSWP